MIDEDALVEAMARAMCEASDQDPDEIETVVKPVNRFSEMQMMGGLSVVVNDTMAEYRTEKLPLWKAFEDDARRQLAAHRAMIKGEKE
jgi:ApbE superfamily uncharacterized protein (UPF0280 family)